MHVNRWKEGGGTFVARKMQRYGPHIYGLVCEELIPPPLFEAAACNFSLCPRDPRPFAPSEDNAWQRGILCFLFPFDLWPYISLLDTP